MLFICAVLSSVSPTIYAQDPAANPLSSVACRYEVINTKAQQKASKQVWHFWRDANMIQTLESDGDVGEIWQQTATGHIQYRKFYPQDKTAIEYMPADKPTNHLDFNWGKLSQMISAEELQSLKVIKKISVHGKEAEWRKGSVNGKDLEVKWLLADNLPASIVRKDKQGRLELRLLDISTMATAKQKPLSIAELAEYRHIDAVDFGDMESDPFVKKILAAEGHHH